MSGNAHELPLFLNKGTEMTLTTIAQSQLWPIVYDQLYAYLEEHDIICKYQSGFRAIHSIYNFLKIPPRNSSGSCLFCYGAWAQKESAKLQNKRACTDKTGLSSIKLV